VELAAAANYRRRTELFAGWRELLVEQLSPRRGDTVLDVCCGTGLNLPALQAAVGPDGTIIAIDGSPRLLTVAARQVARERWDNVELINASAETALLSVSADAALFAAAPEVLASPTALLNLCAHLRAGAAVAAGGWKWPRPWLWPLRAGVTALAGPYVAECTGVIQPWQLLGEHVPDLDVAQFWFGTGYLAQGHTRHAPE
jgi:demethylmenaquinone methyltransferase/2-methoxy-6-polyprenyl-1,4-benzoquinol methylase